MTPGGILSKQLEFKIPNIHRIFLQLSWNYPSQLLIRSEIQLSSQVSGLQLNLEGMQRNANAPLHLCESNDRILVVRGIIRNFRHCFWDVFETDWKRNNDSKRD